MKCTVAVVEAALAAAAKLTDCGVPGMSVTVDGVAVTPVGKPLAVAWMVPENPFSAVAVSETGCAEPPAVRVSVEALAAREKSGCGLLVPAPELLPQPAMSKADAKSSISGTATAT